MRLCSKPVRLCSAVCCSLLQCVAVCCSSLQCIAVWCRVLQCVAVCRSVQQCVAVCCSVLQCVRVCCSVLQGVAGCCRMLRCVAACCSLLQCAAVCHLLQYIAVCCSSLQCDAVCCSEPCVADSQELAHGSCVSSRGEGGGKTQESSSQDSLVRSKKIHPRSHFICASVLDKESQSSSTITCVVCEKGRGAEGGVVRG